MIELSGAELVVFANDAAEPSFQIVDTKLEFRSLAIRNQLAAEEAAKSVSGEDGIALFEAASELLRYELTESDHASVRLLMIVAKDRDLLLDAAEALASGRLTALKAATLLAGVISRLEDINAESLIEFCRALQIACKGDIRPSPFFAPLVTELSKRKELISKSLSVCQNEADDRDSGLYGASLLSLAETDVSAAVALAINGLSSSKSVLRLTNLWVLGVICADGTVPDSQVAVVDGPLNEILARGDNELHRSACSVVADALHVRTLCSKAWKQLLEEADSDALCSLAPVLFRNYRVMKEKREFELMLRQCLPLSPQYPSEVGLIDAVLSRLLSDGAGHNPFIVDWLTEWVARHGAGDFQDRGFIELFGQTVHRLRSERSLLETLVTRWLLHEGRETPAAAGSLLSHLTLHEVEPLDFDIAEIDKLDADGLVFLCRRLLGFVIDEKQLISLMLSLLRVYEAGLRTYRLFAEIAVAEVGYDYPTATLERLKSSRDGTNIDEERNLLDSVIQDIERFVSELDGLPEASELWPPTRLVRNFARARDKAMRRDNRAAHEKSFMAQLAKQIPVKGGTGFFSYSDDRYTAVAQMTTVSAGVTLPRREIFDPVGQALNRLNFQIAKRGDK